MQSPSKLSARLQRMNRTYRTGFELGDRPDEVRGTSDVTVVVQNNDGTYRIVSVRENVENRDTPVR